MQEKPDSWYFEQATTGKGVTLSEEDKVITTAIQLAMVHIACLPDRYGLSSKEKKKVRLYFTDKENGHRLPLLIRDIIKVVLVHVRLKNLPTTEDIIGYKSESVLVGFLWNNRIGIPLPSLIKLGPLHTGYTAEDCTHYTHHIRRIG